MHLLELVSDILDPVVSNYKRGKEIISTEDLVARTQRMNEDDEDGITGATWLV